MELQSSITELEHPVAIVSDVSTPTRNRTERAILEAAVSVLARDRAATLPQIAQAAGVGRTTLHRYFPIGRD